MKIILTADDGTVLDVFGLEEEIGDVSEPLPLIELRDRILEAKEAGNREGER